MTEKRSETVRGFSIDYPPSCPMGYTTDDLETYFGAKQGEDHPLWRQLDGQTGPICDGRRYDHDAKQYESTECAEHPHGYITYVRDVEEWHDGRPVSD